MAKRRKGRDLDGIVFLDKGPGISSNQALQRIKKLFQASKAGHTGSLDPLATGLLPLCFGEASKFSQYLLDADKVYIARIKLGANTTTADSEGEVLETHPVEFAFEFLVNVLSQFVGPQKQVPPMYSALKYQGQPLYKLAREGRSVERKARDISIFDLELKSDPGLFENSYEFDVRVHCSKGTYIRSLAEDIGRAAGCGAHLTALRRIQVGNFDEMHTEGELRQAFDEGGFASLDRYIQPVDHALSAFPSLILDSMQVLALQQGRVLEGVKHPEGCQGLLRLYHVKDGDGVMEDASFIGLGDLDDESQLKSRRLLRTN